MLANQKVFVNKAIFSDPSLKLAQLTFAAFHFTITWFTLYVLSRPRFAFFAPRRASVRDILPLSIAMALNVILPNLSLAFSTVTFYQVARILLTPCVALMNYVLYHQTLPTNAIIALVPACAGVGIVSYYDSLPAADANIKTTSGLGVIFAFAGIFASSLYTVWIASYHRKLQMSSMQLLFNQAPVSAFMLLYVIPFVDTFPVWSTVSVSRWVMILMVSSTTYGSPFFQSLRPVCPIPHGLFSSCPALRQSNKLYLCMFLGLIGGALSRARARERKSENSNLPQWHPAPVVNDSTNMSACSPAASPRSSTSPNSSLLPRRGPSPAPWSATSRRVPLSPSAGPPPAGPSVTSLCLE